MGGQVYRIAIQGHTQNRPHPHVVLIELDKECWIVPAFGADGKEIQGLQRTWQKMGYPDDSAAVLLDNSQHVNYTSSHTGIRAYWVIMRAVRVTKAYLKTQQVIGTMNDAGILLLAEGFVRLTKTNPDRFSKPLQKKVRKLI